jgi:crotonobetainyl-CoA:carnitine CoA-transferase CaiB-like acyl-CoA transferase
MSKQYPLDGIKVVDLGQYIAGPGAAMILLELGAEVVKIEPLSGDQSRHTGFYGDAIVKTYNRSKKSIAIDLKAQRGREVAKKLIQSSDVLIQNLRPGAAERLGLGAEDMCGLHPRLIYVSVSGFGSSEAARGRVGFDIAAQAESGLISVTGETEREPQKVGVPIIDSATTHVVAQAVLAALFQRERTGRGAIVETSLLEVALSLQAANYTDYLLRDVEPQRVGNGQPNNAPAAEFVETRDGAIVLSAYSEDHWARFCRLFERGDLIVDPRFCSNEARVANRAALRATLTELLSRYTSDDCVELLTRNQIVAGVVRGYRAAHENAMVKATGIFRHTQSGSNADYEVMGLPYQLRGMGTRSTRPAPAIGEDGITVLRDAGFREGETADLVTSGIVALSDRG